MKIDLLNLRTELFRPLWTHQGNTEKMRPNLIAMKINFPKPDLNQARTYMKIDLQLMEKYVPSFVMPNNSDHIQQNDQEVGV